MARIGNKRSRYWHLFLDFNYTSRTWICQLVAQRSRGRALLSWFNHLIFLRLS